MRTTACVWLFCSVLIVNLNSLPSTVIIIGFFVFIVLLGLRVPTSRPAVAGILLAVLTLSFSFLQLANHQLTALQVSQDLTVTVRVAGLPEIREGRLAFSANVISCENCKEVLKVQTIQLSWYGGFPDIRADEIWQLTVRLKPPSSLRNVGGFDAVAWALVKGLHAKGYVRKAGNARRLSVAREYALSSLRQGAIDRLASLGNGSPRHGLLEALTVGHKTHISREQWTLLRNTGTAHLLAISGLHIGLVAGWVLLFGQRFGSLWITAVGWLSRSSSSLDPRPWVLCGALTAAMAYAALAGFELPTQRAVLMLCVWMVAALRFRFLPPMTALCIALIVVLAMNPLSLLSAGFWLSFGTVAALLYLHGGHRTALPERSGSRLQVLRSRFKTIGRTHLLLGVVLLPVSAWFFQSGSLVAPLANLVAVPWVAIVCVPLSLLALLASYGSDALAMPLLSLADGSLQILLSYLSWLDDSFLSAVVLTIPDALVFIFVIFGLLLLFAPQGLGVRWLGAPLFLPALLYNTSLPPTEGFEVHVLDVGQGLAAVVFAGEQTLLFDTGGKVSPHLSMFEAVVIPFLHAAGRRRVDTLVISHGDEDHAFGTQDVVRRYPDVRIFSSQPADLNLTANEQALPVSLCRAGMKWTVGGVQFAFIHPASTDKGSDNDRSCVLMVFMGKSRVLFTGDIELPSEQRLLSRLGDLQLFPISLLTAPHHGSKTSSSQAFVDKVRPDYVVFPAGRMNRYGFPHRDVQLRYKLVGSKTFITGTRGMLSFEFGVEGLLAPPTSWWDSRRRFWHGIVNPDCWQHFANQSLALRLLELSQKGQTLCGK